MPLIRSRVNRDALGTKQLTVDGSLPHIGYISSAGIPQCGNFIYIYT
jgi:hypothetical protein